MHNDKNDESKLNEMKMSQNDLRKIYETYKSISETSKNESPMKLIRKVKSTSDNLELSQQQLLDYLMLIKPNSDEIDKIFTQLTTNDTPHKTKSNKLGILSEEKYTKANKFRSMKNLFSLRSSSKSDDESDCKPYKKTSSTGSLTSLTNFILPKRSNSNTSLVLPSRIKSDESGYGSDSTRTTGVDSPRGSIKSQISDMSNNEKKNGNSETATITKCCNNDDTDTAEEDDDIITKKYERPMKKYSSKRLRSQIEDQSDNQFSRRKSIRLRKSPIKKCEDSLVKELNDIYCDKLNKLHLSSENLLNKPKESTIYRVIEKDYKCIRLKLSKNEQIGISMAPNGNGRHPTTYNIISVEPNSAAARYFSN